SVSSNEFMIDAGSLQRREDSESRREGERKRVEERRRQLEKEVSVDGGNTSMDEIESFKDIKKKLIKRTMLRKKRSSQDSETSFHLKKSKEEEKAERRRQRSELRFLKNQGLQTDLIDHSLSSTKSFTQITTQTHGTKKASRKSQTKLTSIERPSTVALEYPISMRRKISRNSIDPSTLSIVSLESPSPINQIDLSTHQFIDLSTAPPSSSFSHDTVLREWSNDDLMRLKQRNEEVKMRRKSSEVEKKLKRRRKVDVSVSGTMRESISSASSISSLLSPENNMAMDEDGMRVTEVSMDVYLLNGQLHQSGYQLIIDPIEGKKEEKTENRSIPSSNGVKRIEIRYDWEEELEDEEDEIIGKSGTEIVGEEEEMEDWCVEAETQTQSNVMERAIQMNGMDMEGINREWGTQSD
ncbi:hypothetical protein PENTCL1PPCAC_2257, partial [Pristionchus entomophagus]